MNKPARVNSRLLVTLLLVVVVLGLGAFTVRHYRKRAIAARALAAGLAAYQRQDWAAAAENFRQYLQRRPTDTTGNRHIEIPEKYADALLRIRPLEPDHVAAALAAYRRVLRLAPERASTYDALAGLYIDLRDYDELAYIARKRREHAPDDPKAALWLATARIGQHKLDEARQELEGLVKRLEAGQPPADEYVLACVMLSNLAAREPGPEAVAQARAWLDRAVKARPDSILARIQRARFLRKLATRDAAQQEALLAAAREDLEAADRLDSPELQQRVLLCQEWIELGDETRAEAALDALERQDEEKLRAAFVTLDEWEVVRFLLRGDLLLRSGRAADAAHLADEVLDKLTYDQVRQRVLPLAVRACVSAGRIEDARRYLEQYRAAPIVAAGGPEAEARLAFLEALVAQAEGRPYRVIALLEPLVERESVDPAAWRLLAQAYGETGQPRRAADVLERAFQRHGLADADARLRLARYRLSIGDWSGALQVAETLDPDDPQAALVRLEARFRQQAGLPRPESEALKALADEAENLCQAYPQLAQTWVLRASIALAAGRADEAERWLRQAVETCPEPFSAALMLARLYVGTDRPKEAQAVCRAACQRHPDSALAWQALSEAAEIAGDTEAARAALVQGLEAVDAPAEARELELRLASFDLRHGDRQAGLERLENLVERYPDDVQARVWLLGLPEVRRDGERAQTLVDELRRIEGEGGLQWRFHQAALWFDGQDGSSRADEIRDLLEYCLDADPAWSAPALLLGELYERRGDPAAAERVYRNLLAADPAAADVADRLVALLERQQRYGEACELLGYEAVGRRADVARRVRVLLGAGRLDEALEMLRRRVAADPADTDARIALAQLQYRQTGDADAALKLLDEAEAQAGASLGITAARVAILGEAGRLEQARRYLDALVESRPGFSACFLRAVFLSRVGETEAAEADFRRLTTLEDRPDGYLLLGMFYADQGRLDEAVATWEAGLVKYPDDPALRRRLMQGLLARGRGDDRQRGLALLDELEARFPDDPELLWVRALLELEQGTPEAVRRAEARLERVVALQPTAVRAHLQRMELALQRGDPRAAEEMAVQALGANPDDPQILQARARIEYALGELDTARTLVRLILQKSPRDPVALHLLARLAVESGSPAALEEARRLVEAALDAGATDARICAARLVLLQAQGSEQEVAAQLEQMRQNLPAEKVVPGLLALARWHADREQAEAVEEYLAEAANLAPQSAEVLAFRVSWLGRRSRWDELAALVERQHDALSSEMLQAAGEALAASEQPKHRDLARHLFERALRDVPPASARWFELAADVYRAGAVERAEALYRQVLADDPDNVRALNDLAWVLSQGRQAHEEALALAERGLQLAPNDVHLHDTRGVILSHLPGRLQEARQDFQRCVALTPAGSPARARALLQLARVTARLNQVVDTRRYLREALEIDRRTGVFSEAERTEIEELQTTLAGLP